MVESIMASDDRTVVFAWSRPELDKLYDTLWKQQPFGAYVVKIDGSTSQVSRDTILAAFKERPGKMILLAQISTLNSGTNALVRASNVVYLSLTQRADEWEQSLGRFHRPGQRSNVAAHVIVARGSVDQTVLDALQGRCDLQSALMSHVKSLAGS
jgi:superfamily II DNA or RNA helicase